ncbi:hypothetical protein GBAR_LOCUS22623 [Geodia barretti]|uniref:Uncharacterized protein n=1 Tax=Geodia barretti TaxID=519541 RepID=A0AA35T434_GEOBA|nr:hypothetical protein GBAR_LOCUS22623 [Geodia barretti]
MWPRPVQRMVRVSPSAHNKSLQSEGNSSLSVTASMNTRYRDVEDETKPLIKRTPVL